MPRLSHREQPPRKRCLAALIVVVVVGAGGLVLWRMFTTAPAWWAPPAPRDERTTRLAERVEYRLAEEAHRIRSDESPWWLEIRQDQVNAWLAARLPEWIAHAHGVEWPAQLGLPQVNIEPDRISIGIEVDRGPRWVVAHLTPRITEAGLVLGVRGVSVGRVRIPGGSMEAILDRLGDSAPRDGADDPDLRAIVELLTGERVLEPGLELSDGRRVRVLDLRLGDGLLLLQCRTAKKTGPGRPPRPARSCDSRGGSPCPPQHAPASLSTQDTTSQTLGNLKTGPPRRIART